MIRPIDSRKLIVTAAAACLTLTTYLIAGPPEGVGRSSAVPAGAGSGPGFDSQNNPGVLLGSQASDASGNPGFNSQNNPGTLGSEFGRSTAADAGTNGAEASQFGRSTAAQAGANGAEHRNSNAFFAGRGRDEEMVETQNKTGETESSEHRSERSEVSKKFDSSLLFAGITPIPSATPGGPGYGPTNNPGLDHMSQQGLNSSESGRTTAETARSNPGARPEARVSPKPSATPGGPGYGPTNTPGLDHMSQQALTSSESGRTTAETAQSNHGASPIPSANP
jgi:hypothetical protein